MTCPACRPFVLSVSERLYLASSCLGHLAEKRTKRRGVPLDPGIDLEEALLRLRRDYPHVPVGEWSRLLAELAARLRRLEKGKGAK